MCAHHRFGCCFGSLYYYLYFHLRVNFFFSLSLVRFQSSEVILQNKFDINIYVLKLIKIGHYVTEKDLQGPG